VKAHTEEERVCDINLDGGHAGGVDLDGGGGRCGTSVVAVGAALR
jgi:hypothetical protein